MLVVSDSATLYRHGMPSKNTKQIKGDPVRGASFKAYLVPKVEGMQMTMEGFTGALDLSKAAATGWFKTGSISLETLHSIQTKFGFPMSEMLAALHYHDSGLSDPSRDAPSALSPAIQRLISSAVAVETSGSATEKFFEKLADSLDALIKGGPLPESGGKGKTKPPHVSQGLKGRLSGGA